MASKITKQQRDEHDRCDQLKALIQDGINAPHVSAEEAEGELRCYADRLASKRA